MNTAPALAPEVVRYAGPMTTHAEAESFELLLDHLRQARGFDFTAYKRSSLQRRVLKRMHAVAIPTFDAYIDYLEVHQDEFEALFNTILINVTGFYRDPDVWSHLDRVVLPQLLENRDPDTPLRVWSAGCASGQEAYSVAMLLAERFGVDGVRDRAKIYATDVDEEALKDARRAVFGLHDIEDVPRMHSEKYFTVDGNAAALHRDLRRAVMFGRLDLLSDAPISRIDLLLCRNTLMYFNAEAQARILGRFSFSVNPTGVLVLGRAEMLFSHSALFAPVDLPRRMFRVVGKPESRHRLGLPAGRDVMTNGLSGDAKLRQAAVDADARAQLLIDPAGLLVSASGGARQQFGLGVTDLGQPLRDLEISYRPVDLRSAIERATAESQEVVLKDVHHFVSGQPRYFDVNVAPILDPERTFIGTRVIFADTTSVHHLQTELSASKQELETAYDELQSTNEELETTNEELQSTIEELETTNEELQSTNEELETMNEELQSTNEELQTMNDELRVRSLDVDLLNSYLQSVFGSLKSGVAVLDRDYRVLVWNRRSEDLWGLRRDEAVGAQFLSLDIGLPVGELTQPIRAVMSGDRPNAEKTITALTRRGKTIECAVAISTLASAERENAGVILLMDEQPAPLP